MPFLPWSFSSLNLVTTWPLPKFPSVQCFDIIIVNALSNIISNLKLLSSAKRKNLFNSFCWWKVQASFFYINLLMLSTQGLITIHPWLQLHARSSIKNPLTYASEELRNDEQLLFKEQPSRSLYHSAYLLKHNAKHSDPIPHHGAAGIMIDILLQDLFQIQKYSLLMIPFSFSHLILI